MAKKILVVEDDASLRGILKDFLSNSGYAVAEAENGEAAIKILEKDYYPVIITDLKMPVMDGKELIDRLEALNEVPVVIVLTSDDDTEVVVDVMRKGVFDYLIKPVKRDDLLMRIERAYNVSELNHIKEVTEKEKVVRLEHQLEWYKMQERMKHKTTKMGEDQLFENLQRSLNQGSGIGTLISLIELFTATARKKDNVYEIDAKIVDQIAENQKLVYGAFEVFRQIEKVASKEVPMEKMSLASVYDLISEIRDDLQELASINDHTILVSEKKPSFEKISMNINVEYIKGVIRELLLNAMKYSEPKSNIMAILERSNGSVELSVINHLKSLKDDGIPMEYENIVFEPFFRKAKYIQEEYKTLDYGLGLTLAEKIVQKHNGKIHIFNIEDFSDFSKNPVTKICSRITFPVLK